MGNIISEGLEHIGRIDDDGYVFDRSGDCVAKINDSGYIGNVGGGEIYGKIDDDGTIRNASGSVVGRVQADGYIYIHSNRICKVSSNFVERITPKAWNAGRSSTYSGRASSESSYNASSSGGFNWPFGVGTTIKLILGVVLGIVLMIMGLSSGSLSFGAAILAIPFSIAIVFIFCFVIKIINGG